jgi:hypothetical protein
MPPPTHPGPDRYLWVKDGKRVKSESFSHRFETLMGKYCACMIKPGSYRQVAVSIAREHILPQYLTEDYTIDEAAHHGGSIAHSHYGVVEGDLPHLTADLVWKHRNVAREWHNVLGVGKRQPPRPLRLLAQDIAHPLPPPPLGSRSHTGPDLDTGPTDPSSSTAPLAPTGLGGVTSQVLEEALDHISERILAKVQRTLMDEILPAVIEKIGVHNCAMAASGSGSGVGPASVEITPGPGPVQFQPSLLESSSQERGHSNFWLTPDLVPTSQRTGMTSPTPAPNDDVLSSLPPSSIPTSTSSLWSSSLAPVNLNSDPWASGAEISESQANSESTPISGRHTTRSLTGTTSIIDDDSWALVAKISEPQVGSESTPTSSWQPLATEARQGLRLLFRDPAVAEKSAEQLEYVMACIESRSDLQVVLPTGGGKSAGWQVLAMLDRQRVSVIITPYTLLLEDQLRSAREKGIVAEHFSGANSRPRADVQLIFVQPETVAQGDAFKKWVLPPGGLFP